MMMKIDSGKEINNLNETNWEKCMMVNVKDAKSGAVTSEGVKNFVNKSAFIFFKIKKKL